MPDLTKIATCCYCGARTVLRLRGTVRHELACASCGARLHNMKPLPVPKSVPRHRPTAPLRHRAPPRPKRRKRRIPRLAHLIEEIWDEIEDIFD